MELKIVKTSSEDYQNLYKKYVTEMQANGVYETTESFFLKNDDKHALIFYNNNVALGFVSYRYDIFNLVSSHMYIDPTIRMIGVEETVIKVVENLYNKSIHFIILNNDTYLSNILKGMGYFRSSSKSLGSIKKFFDMYTKDNDYRYTKLIINLNALYSKDSKLEAALKRILKLYGIKPKADTIKAYKSNVKAVEARYIRHELTDDEYFRYRFQKYMNQYDIHVDPTLCYRIYNSSKVKLNPGAKKFLKICGKHKHIFIISSMKPDDLEELIKSLKLRNISNIYNLPINYDSLKKIIKNNKYRNIMEYCYIDNRQIDIEMLRAGIDTLLVSPSLDAQYSFYFKKQAQSFAELQKIILKK